MSHIAVSAIIPTYNRAAYIKETIDSLLNQTYPIDELIVVNDGSTDTTSEILKSYTDTRIKIFHQSNQGKSVALNFAITKAVGDFIWICDDDDIAAPEGLASLVAAIEREPDTDMVFGKMLSFYESDPQRTLHDLNYPIRPEEPNPKINFLEFMVTNQFAMLVRKKLYDTVGPFRHDLIRSEDIEMVLRLTRHAKVIAIPDYIFHYRIHAGQRGSSADLFKASENKVKWQAYSEIFYKEVRETYALEEFCPTFALKWNPTASRRAQLLERSCIFANQSLWSEALEDIELAVSTDASAASPEEVHLAGSVIIHDLPWERLVENQSYKKRMRSIKDGSQYGKDIVFALCYRLMRQAMRHILKKHEYREGFKSIAAMLEILTPLEFCNRILRLRKP